MLTNNALSHNIAVMVDTSAIAATRGFLMLLHDGPTPSRRELLRSLDQLAIAYHDTPNGDPSDSEVTPPKMEYQERYASLAKRFSSYGYYAFSEPTEPAGEAAMDGDAIDDLADIATDLEEVMWRFKNLGADDAHWYYRFHFEAHFGRHLRKLSLYLHMSAPLGSDED